MEQKQLTKAFMIILNCKKKLFFFTIYTKLIYLSIVGVKNVSGRAALLGIHICQMLWEANKKAYRPGSWATLNLSVYKTNIVGTFHRAKYQHDMGHVS